ncbi:MAG: ferrous iron transport protein A [Candidatus Wallbacteria bacterium]|nr:ferrous iron transport protein A [Candidatus Wallbacteria bacterium]
MDRKSKNQEKTLADVEEGFRGHIRDVRGDSSTCSQLLEMGFTPGQAVALVASSPFRDPLAFSLRGTIIALRRKEARCILI